MVLTSTITTDTAVPALQVTGLAKTYDGGFEALKGVDLRVERGDFFALLGPNGAGKSTLISIVAGLVNKSAGAVAIFGHDTTTEAVQAKTSLGLVPQEFNFNVFEPVEEILINSAGYHGIPRRHAIEKAGHYLNLLELYDKRRAVARSLSGGMKRRLMIARALVHDPGLLILDEPTAGVDIEIRRATWSFLERINQEEGKTIILTTHYLEEAESLCRNVAIIDHGKIIERGAVAQLLGEAHVETFVLDLEPGVTAAQLQALALPGFVVNPRNELQIEVEVPRGESLSSMFRLLAERELTVRSLRNKTNRLEEFFLRLVSDGRESAGEQS